MKKLSIVIPTRDRPGFVDMSLQFMCEQDSSEFEVVLLDNPSSNETSCLPLTQRDYPFDLVYSRADKQLSMVDNWSRWSGLASGEKVSFIPDRAFFLPGAIDSLLEIISQTSHDLYNIHPVIFYPNVPSDCMSSPGYLLDGRGWDTGLLEYVPSEWLEYLYEWECGYFDLPPWLGTRGMVFYGVASRKLLNEMSKKHGSLFRFANPENTSRILLLDSARSGASITKPLLVAPYFDSGNASLSRKYYVAAKSYYDALDGSDQNLLLLKMLIPNLITVHSICSAELSFYREALNLPFRLNKVNSYALILDDIFTLKEEGGVARENKEAVDLFYEHLEAKGMVFVKNVEVAWANLGKFRAKLLRDKNERISSFPKVYLDSMNDCLKFLAGRKER